ncbi:glycosyltransferase [Helicobacter labacensis]|uniref:glycosyltransferase n=1 Tax=Helicobacter labacensis TaxID=2316079 RepID=UPI002E261C20
MLRLVLPSLFPQYDKIISCDVDVVFSQDLSASYFTLNPDDPYYFAAAKEFGPARVEKLIKRRKREARRRHIDFSEHALSMQEWEIMHANSFNVGFMVLNLKAWRKDNLESRCLDFLRAKHHVLLYPEQETLILMCHGRILELPYTYNVYPKDFDNPTHPIHKHISDSKEVIMWHFYGDSKPWYLKNFRISKRWILALLSTPFALEYFEKQYQSVEMDSGAYYELLRSILKKDILLGYLKHRAQTELGRLRAFCARYWEKPRA